jgi:hypothetical protein
MIACNSINSSTVAAAIGEKLRWRIVYPEPACPEQRGELEVNKLKSR